MTITFIAVIVAIIVLLIFLCCMMYDMIYYHSLRIETILLSLPVLIVLSISMILVCIDTIVIR